jgi:ELWxxDGT repeat protein
MINKYTTVIIALMLLFCKTSAQSFSLVKDIAPISSGFQNSFPAGFTSFNSKIYFTAFNGQGGHKLYQSDGTSDGTVVVGPSVGLSGTVYYLTSFNGKLFFTYNDGVNGLELWVSDGTTGGTVMLKDIWVGSSSAHPQYFTEAGGKLFFQASDASRSQGLWATDGTEAGTVMVKNMYAAPSNGMTKFMQLNSKIYFIGNIGSGYGLWVSDGTLNGTQLVKSGLNANGNYAVLNDKIYFSTGDSNGNELWVSDGTLPGTLLLKNIRSDSLGAYSSNPDNFFTSNSKVYFTADDGVAGKEWWVTDGTNSGTHIVKDIAVGPNTSQPGIIIEFKGEVYIFVLNNGSGQMYKTDGTEAGTVLIKTTGYVSYVYEFNSKLYFLQGLEVNATIWSSDGTPGGTNQILPPVQSYYQAGLTFIGYNNELFFPGIINDMGIELCKLSFPTAVHDRSGKNGQLNSFALEQNYPNPFNPSTIISYQIPVNSNVSLKVYDAIGREVATLVNDEKEAGYYSETFNAVKLSSGIYFARLQYDGKHLLKKMLLVK